MVDRLLKPNSISYPKPPWPPQLGQSHERRLLRVQAKYLLQHSQIDGLTTEIRLGAISAQSDQSVTPIVHFIGHYCRWHKNEVGLTLV